MSIAEQIKCKVHPSEYITNYCAKCTFIIIEKLVICSFAQLAYVNIHSIIIERIQNLNTKTSNKLTLKQMKI
jgi:hypothetical protein